MGNWTNLMRFQHRVSVPQWIVFFCHAQVICVQCTWVYVGWTQHFPPTLDFVWWKSPHFWCFENISQQLQQTWSFCGFKNLISSVCVIFSPPFYRISRQPTFARNKINDNIRISYLWYKIKLLAAVSICSPVLMFKKHVLCDKRNNKKISKWKKRPIKTYNNQCKWLQNKF